MEENNKKEKKGSAFIMWIAVGVVIVIFILITISSNAGSARSQGQYIACMSNCKNIAIGIEIYSTDNEGHVPPNLSSLTPDAMKFIPTCPSAGRDTYSQTYKASINKEDSSKDTFSFHCSGFNHGYQTIYILGFIPYTVKSGIPPDYPQFDSVKGLIRK